MRVRRTVDSGVRPLAMALTAMLVGCAAGPDFKRPEAPQATAYAPGALSATTASAPVKAGAAQRIDISRQVPAHWWEAFRSPPLNALVERALKANPTIEAARAALGLAQENVYAQQGYFFPSVQASYSPARTKLSGNTGGNSPGIQGDGTVISTYQGTPANAGGSAPFSGPVIYNFHTAQLTVGYTPDVFGGLRRQVESLQAQADAQRFELEAAKLTLASNVVAAAIQEASLRAQISAARKAIDANARSLEILTQQFQLGFASRLDVAATETALAQTEMALPPLTKQLEQTRDLIRVLAGNTPDRDVDEVFELDSLHLPQDLPLSVPSKLVQQRPDVRAAEELLHVANAQVGVAVANRFPQFSITGHVGGNASLFSQMFQPAGKFFDLTGMVSQSLFDGGTLMHQHRAAEQALLQASAQYRSAVLTAFQNVADTLHALYADADALQAAARAEQAAKTSLDLTRNQHEAGFIGLLAVLIAEQAYQQASMALVQARATRLGDTAGLFQALGGGWTDEGAKAGPTLSQIGTRDVREN